VAVAVTVCHVLQSASRNPLARTTRAPIAARRAASSPITVTRSRARVTAVYSNSRVASRPGGREDDHHVVELGALALVDSHRMNGLDRLEPDGCHEPHRLPGAVERNPPAGRRLDHDAEIPVVEAEAVVVGGDEDRTSRVPRARRSGAGSGEPGVDARVPPLHAERSAPVRAEDPRLLEQRERPSRIAGSSALADRGRQRQHQVPNGRDGVTIVRRHRQPVEGGSGRTGALAEHGHRRVRVSSAHRVREPVDR